MLLRRLFSLSTYSLRKLTSIPPLAPFSVSGKKILNPNDIPMKAYEEMTWAIAACHNCKMMAELLKANLSQMSDYQLSLAIYQIYRYDLDLDDHFYNTIIPIVKEFLKNADRESNRTFAEIVSFMGWMKIQDEGFWTLVEQRLLTDRLYRYLTLDQLIDVTSGISTANKGNIAMFETFEKVFIKHRLALDEDKTEVIRKAFEDKQLGSNLLFKVLENPKASFEEGKEEKKTIEHH